MGEGDSGSTSEVRNFVSCWHSSTAGRIQTGKPAAAVQNPPWRDLRWTALCPRERLTDAQTDEIGRFREIHRRPALSLRPSSWCHKFLPVDLTPSRRK